MEIKSEGLNYEMTDEELQDVKNFLEEIKSVVSPERYGQFCSLIEHLCEVQNPYNKEYPFIDNITHGIAVARVCIMKDPNISEALLLAAIGHDWDRACGEKRIKSTDFPNTKEGNKQYKDAHAKNSANFYCKELAGRFEQELIDKVYEMVLKHEIGGEGDLATLDFADGIVFFDPKNAGYYRLGRKYKGADGQKLTGDALEEERRKGFETKVRFMSETLDNDEKVFLKKYILGIRERLESVVRDELDVLLKNLTD